MKRFLAALFLLLIFQVSLQAQKEIISAATDFIVARRYAAANYYLDSILKKDPKSVDALMMKGNVILNRFLDTVQSAQFITAEDESIFTTTISEKPKILPVKIVYAIEKIWKECLRLDSTRSDIHKGLCSIYSMALMKNALEKEIVQLMKTEKDDGEQAFRICEYPRKFKERNKFDEAMELYQYVAKLYPNVPGVRCDIASEYFYSGKMNEALAWLDSSYNFKTVDETSFLNGAFIYSELGYFDDAQNVLNTYSHIYQRKLDQFYYGLRLFSDSSDKYFEVLNTFIQTADTNSYSDEVYAARQLLACHDLFSLKNYSILAADNSIPDYYKALIHTRAMKQFANNCEPFVSYGVYQSSIKNYSAAVQFLEEGKDCEINPQQKNSWMLHYAYGLFMSGEKEKSLTYFRLLADTENPFTKQAAEYFSAKILFESGKREEAKKLLKEIISSVAQTKYTELATHSLN